MQKQLSDETLALVKLRLAERGAMRTLAQETEIPYIWIWRFHNGKLTQIDADKCQKLYEHLSGRVLI